MDVYGSVVVWKPYLPGVEQALREGTLDIDIPERLKRVVKRGITFMGALSDWAEDKVLRAFAGTAFSITTGYVGLFTASPGETGGGTEVSGGSYARQSRAGIGAAGGYNAPVAGEPSIMDNFDAISYPTATANWGSIAAASLHDALTAGNLAFFGALTTAKTVNSGDTFRFNAGAYDLGLS